MTDHPVTKVSLIARVVATCSVAICSVTIAGIHPAKLVPKNAAAFMVFPHMADSSQRVGDFINRAQPGFSGFDLAEFEMTVGFAPGTIDLTKPVVIIADRPEDFFRLFNGNGLNQGDAVWPVVGFIPANPEAFSSTVSGGVRENGAVGVKRVTGAFGRYRIVMRDGFAFVAPRGAALAKIARLKEDDSAWSAMSETAQRDAVQSDVFIQLSMSSWRPLFESKLRAITEIMKVGIQLQQPDPKRAVQTRKLADWFFSGALDGANQMETASAALTFTGDRVRLAHHQTFRRGEWMADYLRKVRRVDHDELWASFPDRSFLFGMSSNWKAPPEYCLALRFNRKCMEDPSLCQNLSKAARAQLDRDIRLLQEKTLVGEFVVTSEPGGMLPLRVLGSYATRTAPQTLKVMQRIQKHSKELVGSLMPGSTGIGKKPKPIDVDGMTAYQVSLVDPSASQIIQDNLRRMYGPGAVYQEAAADDNTIVYSVGDPATIRQLADVVRGKTPRLSSNPRIKAAMAAMPPDANLYALFDTKRLLESIPMMIRPGIGGAVASDNTPARDGLEDSVGPLLGWSATVHNNHVDCGFTMTSSDMIQTMRAFSRMREQLSHASGGGAPGRGLATERPVPFAMTD